MDAKNVGDIQGNDCVQGFSTRPLCNAFGAVIIMCAVTLQRAQKRCFLLSPLRRTTTRFR